MAQNPNNLVWIDMEMSGLYPDTDRVIEVALVITDSNLETIAEAPVLVVHQPDSVLDGMDAWNKSTHAKSGLIEKVKASLLDEATVEAQMVEFLKEYVRQLGLPGSALPGALDAETGGLLPLPQPGRQHRQGARQTLETGSGAGHKKTQQA